jgi:hypothetical protein
MLVAVITAINCQTMSLLWSVLQLLACITNYIWLLSGPCNFPVLEKCKLCHIFFFLWKCIPCQCFIWTVNQMTQCVVKENNKIYIILMYCEINLYAPFVVRRYQKQKQYNLWDCETIHIEKFCHTEGLKHVGGTAYMTNVYLLLTVQIFGLYILRQRKWLSIQPGCHGYQVWSL